MADGRARRIVQTKTSGDGQIIFPMQNDVFVDDDFGISHHSRWAVATKCVRTTAFRDGVTDALLIACKLLPRCAATPAITSCAAVSAVASSTTVTARA